MGLDIRLPIGLMFTILGPILIVTGIVDGTSLNTYTGSAMLAFGVIMLVFGILGQRRENAAGAVAEAEAPAPSAERSRDDSAPLKMVA
jgi:hypothetical protein